MFNDTFLNDLVTNKNKHINQLNQNETAPFDISIIMQNDKKNVITIYCQKYFIEIQNHTITGYSK